MAPDRPSAAAAPRVATRAVFFAALTFALALGVGAVVVHLAEQSRLLAKQRHAGITAADHGSAVQQQVYYSLSATYTIAAVLRRHGGELRNFDTFASELLPLYPSVSALQLAPDGVIRDSVPLAGNEKAIGHDLLADPKRNKEAFLAVETRRLTLAGPFELLQGGVAVIGRLPVYLPDSEDRFWGFATAVIRVGDLIRASRLETLAGEGYHYELWRMHPDTGRMHVFAESGGGVLADPASYEFEVPNGRWTLSAAPVGGWYSYPSLAFEGALALLASLLAAFIAYSAARQPERLRRLVAVRTRDLESEIAERVRAQGALMESEDRLRSLVEATSDWVWEVDENAVYTYASPKVRDLLGYAPEELLGRTPFSLMPSEEAERVGAAFAAIAAERRPFELVEYVTLHRDGHRVVLETSGVPIFDAGGNFRGYRGIDRDITHRKIAEERIRKLSRAVEQSANAVIITDVEGGIEYANPKFCEITGYALEEVLGRNPRLLKSGEHPREMYEEMWKTLKAGREWFGEFHNRKKNGELFWCLQAISAIRDERDSVTHFVSVTEDISSRKLAESTIRQLAYYDSLTQLPNRRLFRDRLEQAAAGAKRAGQSLALLYLNMDRLKNVNDSLGHAVGDALLKAIAERIVDTVRSEDTVARLEGDEFAVLLAEVGDTKSVARVAEKLASALQRPFRALGHELYATFGIGVSVYPQDTEDLNELNRNADIALHGAKQVGDSFRFFTPGMNAAVAEYLRLENSLRKAVERDEFALYVQPQADLDTGCIGGVEALVRWRHPEMGIVEPAQFIQLAEETGLVVPIGEWVLREACREAKTWQAAGRPVRVAVNLSPRQFRERHLIRTVADALADSGLPAALLELEITESMLMGNFDDSIATLRQLAEMGLTIAVDDFGTGYSSLGYLKRMPIQILKIDSSFVQELAISPDDRAIVSAVVALAHELKLKVIAEGVETYAQLDYLRTLGCDKVQGYLLSRPLRAADFGTLLHSGRLPQLVGPVSGEHGSKRRSVESQVNGIRAAIVKPAGPSNAR